MAAAPIPMPNLTGGGGGPSGANGGQSMFDSSGWNVNFGSGEISSSASKSGGDLSTYLPWALAALAIVAWLKFNRKA